MKTTSDDHMDDDPTDEAQAGSRLPPPPIDRKKNNGLHRGLSARQVQMIAIAGTIGTGLFLGTGRSLAQGGPASILICYAIIGFIVYITLLLLGEMATQYPVAGGCSYFRLNERGGRALSFDLVTFRFFSFFDCIYPQNSPFPQHSEDHSAWSSEPMHRLDKSFRFGQLICRFV
jgi:amino acid permease